MKYHEKEELKEKLRPYTSGLNIHEEYVDKSIAFEEEQREWEEGKKKGLVYFTEVPSDGRTLKRIVDRAISLQTLYDTASQLKINPKYINSQVGMLLNRRGIEFSDAGKMKRRDIQKILNRAAKLQKRNNDLTSKLALFTISVGIIIEGLFLLSSNITGYAISNLTNPLSSIIGASLFVGGLIAAFFLTKR